MSEKNFFTPILEGYLNGLRIVGSAHWRHAFSFLHPAPMLSVSFSFGDDLLYFSLTLVVSEFPFYIFLLECINVSIYSVVLMFCYYFLKYCLTLIFSLPLFTFLLNIKMCWLSSWRCPFFSRMLPISLPFVQAFLQQYSSPILEPRVHSLPKLHFIFETGSVLAFWHIFSIILNIWWWGEAVLCNISADLNPMSLLYFFHFIKI